jgi:hypothetical protein
LKKLILFSLGLAIILNFSSQVSHANPSGVNVSPILEQITLQKNQTSTTFSSTVANHTDSLVTVNLEVKNFSSLNEKGGLNFSSQPGYFQDHGLASSILPEHNQLVIGPNQSVNDVIAIKNTNKLAPGGHYAAVLYRINAPYQVTQNSVNVNEAIAGLIFLSTNGQGYQSLALATPSIGETSTTVPSNLNLVFKNNGNVQSVLNGYVQILNSNKQPISQAEMNTSSNLILPGSDRLFNIQLTRYKNSSFFPKHYYLKVNYGYAGQQNYTTYTSSFYLVNRIFIISVVVLIILMIALAVFAIRFIKNRSLKEFVLEPVVAAVSLPVQIRQNRKIPIKDLSGDSEIVMHRKVTKVKQQR